MNCSLVKVKVSLTSKVDMIKKELTTEFNNYQ